MGLGVLTIVGKGDHRVPEEGEYVWEVPTYDYGILGQPGDRFRLALYDVGWRAVARSTEFMIAKEGETLWNERKEGNDAEL